MSNHYEFPLVFFTTLSQWGIGGILALTCHQAFAGPEKVLQGKPLRIAVILVWTILCLGSLSSLAHLGSPFWFYRAFYNPERSWLTREVISFIALNGAAFLWLLSCWLTPTASRRNLLLGWLTVVCGLVTLAAMTMIYYQLKIHPLWRTPATYLGFYGTTLLMGFATVLLILNAMKKSPAAILKWGLGLGWLLVSAALIIRFQIKGADATSYLLWWQILATLVGAGILLALHIGRRMGSNWGVAASVGYMAVLFSGEFAGRMLYYGNVMSRAPWF